MENASLLLQMKFLSLLPCRNQSGSQSASVVYGERKQLSARLRKGREITRFRFECNGGKREREK